MRFDLDGGGGYGGIREAPLFLRSREIERLLGQRRQLAHAPGLRPGSVRRFLDWCEDTTTSTWR